MRPNFGLVHEYGLTQYSIPINALLHNSLCYK